MGSGTTAKWAFPYPVPSDPNNVPADVQALAQAVENIMAAAATCTSTPSASKFGKFYYNTTNGQVLFDTGTVIVNFGALATSAGSISTSAPGDAAAAGATGLAADAGHKHGRESAAVALTGPAAITTYSEALVTIATSGSSHALDLSAGHAFKMTLTANCTVSFSNVPATAGLRQSIAVALVQDGTGARTVTWPASVHWGNFGAPVLSTAAGKVDVIGLFTDDGGTTWYGFPAGLGF